MKKTLSNIKLLAIVLFCSMVVTSCEELEKLEKETAERNLRNLREWNVNSDTSADAISEFGYENCFRIVAVEDFWWNDYTTFYQGDKSDVNRNELSSVRTLFYCKNSMNHIKVGEIICNRSIANDLLTIFRQLYEANYDIDTLMPATAIDYSRLVDDASPSYNFTFCFHFLTDPLDQMLLKGLAVIVNPYSPPTSGDLAVKLFKQHGFSWGGDESGGKRYRFEKK